MAKTVITLEDCRRDAFAPELPKLSPADYQLLWISDFWDGPVSGLLRHGAREYWFEMCQENDEVAQGQWCRRYAVVALTPDQLAYEHRVDDDFRKYVGSYWDCRAPAESRGFHPQEQHHLFYEQYLSYCRNRNFEASPVIAWFET